MTKHRWTWTFDFFDSLTEAIDFCDSCERNATPYVRKKYAPHWHKWESIDGKEHKYIVWYVY